MTEQRGSGWGDYKQGQQASIEQVKQGDILLVHSKQFNAKNVVRVLRLDSTGLNRPLFYGFFIDPEDTEALELRHPADRDFVIWDFDLEGQYFFAE